MAPLTLAFTLLLCGALYGAKRRWVGPIFVFAVCLIPYDQALNIAGLDFKVVRLISLIGVLRMLTKGDYRRRPYTKCDKIYFAWITWNSIAGVILWASIGMLIYKLGVLVDYLVAFIVLRAYVTNVEDVRRMVRSILWCTIVLAPAVAFELVFHKNAFFMLGRDFVLYRDGEIRCTASFSHPILLGSFAASVMPLALYSYINSSDGRLFSVLSVISSLYITYATASSGPVMALGAGVACYYMFVYRRFTKHFFYSVVALASVLHVIMSAPVWHLISRINLTGSSTGYHRFYLIDKTVENFTEWALVGVRGVAHWGIHWGDVTSMYVAQAVDGGIGTLGLFVWLLIEVQRRFLRASLLYSQKAEQLISWGLYSAMITHILSFLSVGYFGQMSILIVITVTMSMALGNMSDRKRMEGDVRSGN